MPQKPLEPLYELLGYRFENPDLLREALSHPSIDSRQSGRPDYERLEFLGDRVLGLVISARLFDVDKKATAGELAVRFNALVRQETLAEVAREMGLGRHLVLSRGEDDRGGREKAAILSNACEAVLAALYLDGGLDAAEACILRYWSDRIARADEAEKDAKTRLQELVQKDSQVPPNYRIVDQSGPPHDPRFTVEVQLKGRMPQSGTGKSRRAAEQAAAAAMLAELNADG